MIEKGKNYCSYECRDVGFDCDWRCSDINEDELIKKIEKHGAEAHNKKMNPEGLLKIKKLIKKPRTLYPGHDILVHKQMITSFN